MIKPPEIRGLFLEIYLRYFFFILSMSVLFSCNPDPSRQAVESLLKALENQKMESIRVMVPQFSELQDDEIVQICQRLDPFYRNPQIEITPSADQSFSVKLESSQSRGLLLSFSMKQNHEGGYYLSELFAFSRHLDIITAD